MQNIKKLYNRLTMSMVKNRSLLLFIAVQNIILMLLVLMYTNVIISNSKASGELNYQQIKLFYNAMLLLLLLLSCIYAPYFLAGSINHMKKNNTIEYLLATKVKASEIIYATYFRGLLSIGILLVSAFPIVCVSFYFGGVGIAKALKYIVFLFTFTVLFSSVCIFISTIIKDSNLSTVTAYIVGLIIYIIHIIYLFLIIDKNLLLFLYVIFSIIISIVLVFLSSKSRILRV